MGLSNPPVEGLERYQRQALLPQVGAAGQARLAAANVVLVGCGALGTVIADQLVRAGVGSLRLVDRDVVEWSNLQRQVLFDEADARDGTPKAVAAQRRLAAVNSAVRVEGAVADFHAGNAETLAGVGEGGRRPDVILDGTDNVETRYLMNDLAVKHSVPWVYGACVGTVGRVMPVRPGLACLRCVFQEPPGAGELPTCDTAGVLGPAAAAVGSLQAAGAIKLIVGAGEGTAEVGFQGDDGRLVTLDVWSGRFHAVSLREAKRSDCPTCGRRVFEFLDRRPDGSHTMLCGRRAVQVRPAGSGGRVDLSRLAGRLAPSTEVQRTPYLIRCAVPHDPSLQLTVFADGRAIVQGTTDPARARSIYSRYVGS